METTSDTGTGLGILFSETTLYATCGEYIGLVVVLCHEILGRERLYMTLLLSAAISVIPLSTTAMAKVSAFQSPLS